MEKKEEEEEGEDRAFRRSPVASSLASLSSYPAMNSCRGRIRKLLEINRSLKFEKEEEKRYFSLFSTRNEEGIYNRIFPIDFKRLLEYSNLASFLVENR